MGTAKPLTMVYPPVSELLGHAQGLAQHVERGSVGWVGNCGQVDPGAGRGEGSQLRVGIRGGGSETPPFHAPLLPVQAQCCTEGIGQLLFHPPLNGGPGAGAQMYQH